MAFLSEMFSFYNNQVQDCVQNMSFPMIIASATILWWVGMTMLSKVIKPCVIKCIAYLYNTGEYLLFGEERNWVPTSTVSMYTMAAVVVHITCGALMHRCVGIYYADAVVLLDSFVVAIAAIYTMSTYLCVFGGVTLVGVCYFQWLSPSVMHNQIRDDYAQVYFADEAKMQELAASMESVHMYMVIVYTFARSIVLYYFVDTLAVSSVFSWTLNKIFHAVESESILNFIRKIMLQQVSGLYSNWIKFFLALALVAQSITVPMHFVPRMDAHFKTEGDCNKAQIVNTAYGTRAICEGDEFIDVNAYFCPAISGLNSITGYKYVETDRSEDEHVMGTWEKTIDMFSSNGEIIAKMWKYVPSMLHTHYHGDTQKTTIIKTSVRIWDPYSIRSEHTTKELAMAQCAARMQQWEHATWTYAAWGVLFASVAYQSIVRIFIPKYKHQIKWGFTSVVFYLTLFFVLMCVCDWVSGAPLPASSAFAISQTWWTLLIWFAVFIYSADNVFKKPFEMLKSSHTKE